MSVRIRLTRVGRKKVPHYRIVVMDARNRRDGAFIEQLGVYHPKQQPAQFDVREDLALKWLMLGATPTDTVRSLFSRRGIMLRYSLLKKDTPPEKIEAAVSEWREAAAIREAKRAASPPRRKAKASTSETTKAS